MSSNRKPEGARDKVCMHACIPYSHHVELTGPRVRGMSEVREVGETVPGSEIQEGVVCEREEGVHLK